MPQPKSPKRAVPRSRPARGEWVELLFMAHAARLGLNVIRPHGQNFRFDVIVQCGDKLYRVQVKSTLARLKSGTHYLCNCHWTQRPQRWQTQKHHYSAQEIDFIAAYVIPEDAWFIIPAQDLRSKSLHLPARSKAAHSRYGCFLDAWHLLGAGRRGLTIQAEAEPRSEISPGVPSQPIISSVVLGTPLARSTVERCSSSAGR